MTGFSTVFCVYPIDSDASFLEEDTSGEFSRPTTAGFQKFSLEKWAQTLGDLNLQRTL